MTSPRILSAVLAMAIGLLSSGGRAEDAQQQTEPPCPQVAQPFCTMTDHMGLMVQRMAQMRGVMLQCVKPGARCDKSAMMSAMKDMEDRMGDMMKFMMTMSEEQKKPVGHP
ncbi:MAG: hypothetical protein K2P94_17810 [Rhodospirillaceae bacterium]|nr:hypothetical protein [Rhodospirillaceae bacterium]